MKPTVAVLALILSVGCQPVSPDSTDAAGEPAGTARDSVATAASIAGVFGGTAGHWVDLTHPFDENSIYWPTDTLGFRLEELAHGTTDGGWFYSSYRYSAAEHGGTHLDAPIHFAENGWTNAEIPLASLIGPAVVVDITDRVNPDYLVSVQDLQGWETQHGRIPDGAIVLARTGWGTRYDDRTAYLGTDLTGPEAVPQLHFPGLDPEAAQWLADNRSIAAFGIDTPSVDYGQSTDFRTHVILYARNIPGFENVAELETLPPSGAYVVALPMKIEGGSGGPLRIVGFVPG